MPYANEGRQTQMAKSFIIPLYDIPEKTKLQEQKTDQWSPGARVGRRGVRAAKGNFQSDGTVLYLKS